MTQGYVFIGTDDHGHEKNIRQAYALSLMVKILDQERETCVAVKNSNDVPTHYQNGFDYIIELPFGRTEPNHSDINIDFWQTFYFTPFDESMFLTSCSFATNEIKSLWDIAAIDDIVFSNALDFRGDKIPPLENNKISTLHSDMVYFKNTEKASNFFKMADPVFKNWRDIYTHLHIDRSNFDLSIMNGATSYLLGESYVVPKYFNYAKTEQNDIDQLNFWLSDSLELKINNYKQSGIVKYTDENILTDEMIRQIDEHYRNQKRK